MTPTKVQVENEKIAQAMKGRALARRTARSQKVQESAAVTVETCGNIMPDLQGAEVSCAKPNGHDGSHASGGSSWSDPLPVNHDAGLQEGERPLSRPMTAKERAVSGRAFTPAPKPSATKSSRKPKTKAQTDAEKRRRSVAAEKSRKVAQAKAAKAKTPKVARVLEDPIDNARLIRMRAKWTAIRRERDVARLEEAAESTDLLLGEIPPALQVARAEYEAALQAERDAYAAYRVLLEGRKADKAMDASESGDPIIAAGILNSPDAAPAETASTVAEAAEGAE